MTQKQHLPLTKPPQATQKEQENAVAVIPKITQQRMATLNRWNKLFAVLCLLFLSLGFFFYLQWDKDRKALTKDRKELARYEKIFEQSYQGNTLTFVNNGEFNLAIDELTISYIDLNKDSIIYKDMSEMFTEDGYMHIDGKDEKPLRLGDKILEKNIQILSFGIFFWKKTENGSKKYFRMDKLPKTGRILL